jgi:hypothetical protein
MSYVLESYYTGTYFGASAGTDFNRLAARASDDITNACPMQARDALGEALDLTGLSLEQVALLKKATCAQIEYYVQNGDDYNDGASGSGARIGSYSEGTSGRVAVKNPAGLAPRASAYLEQSGLMARAVKVIGRRNNSQDFMDE